MEISIFTTEEKSVYCTCKVFVISHFREVPKKSHKGETTEKGDGEPAPKKAKTDDEHETITVKKVYHIAKVIFMYSTHTGLLDTQSDYLKGVFEPRHEKTNIVVSEQVRHKPSCTSTEDGERLDSECRGIIL